MQLSDLSRDRRCPVLLSVRVVLCAALFALTAEPLLRIWRNLPVLVNRSPSALLAFASEIQPLAALLLFFAGIFIFSALFLFGDRIGDFLFRQRYPLAAALLVLCVALDVSGSSIHMWSDYLSSPPLTGESSERRALSAATSGR